MAVGSLAEEAPLALDSMLLGVTTKHVSSTRESGERMLRGKLIEWVRNQRGVGGVLGVLRFALGLGAALSFLGLPAPMARLACLRPAPADQPAVIDEESLVIHPQQRDCRV